MENFYFCGEMKDCKVYGLLNLGNRELGSLTGIGQVCLGSLILFPSTLIRVGAQSLPLVVLVSDYFSSGCLIHRTHNLEIFQLNMVSTLDEPVSPI